MDPMGFRPATEAEGGRDDWHDWFDPALPKYYGGEMAHCFTHVKKYMPFVNVIEKN